MCADISIAFHRVTYYIFLYFVFLVIVSLRFCLVFVRYPQRDVPAALGGFSSDGLAKSSLGVSPGLFHRVR